MLPPIRLEERLASVFSPGQSAVLAEVIQEAYSDLVRAKDFSELKEIVGALAAAQERTEHRVEELVDAQQRTEQRVEELAVAQQRTEQRVEELAVAQQRTEHRVEELAVAQQRTEQRVEELAVAQQRTEHRVEELAVAQRRTEHALLQLGRQVGGLSDRLGADLEDVAYYAVRDVLQQKLGWQVAELSPSWQKWNGKEEEIDIFGEAHDPAQPDAPIWIVGEVKFNLTAKDVTRFVKKVARARKHLTGAILPICFCYRARPDVEQAAVNAGLRVVYSYGRFV